MSLPRSRIRRHREHRIVATRLSLGWKRGVSARSARWQVNRIVLPIVIHCEVQCDTHNFCEGLLACEGRKFLCFGPVGCSAKLRPTARRTAR